MANTTDEGVKKRKDATEKAEPKQDALSEKTQTEETMQRAASAAVADESSWWKHSHGFLLSALAAIVAVLIAYIWKDARLQKTIHELELKSPLHTLDHLWHAFDHGNASVYDRTPDRIGRVMAARGAKVKYPIVLIPGFVTSGLELWHGHECASGLFRSRLWTHINMASSFFSDKQCWMKHISLNYSTGLDPDGIRVRNAQGLDAIDYFMPGYAVWAKTIEALADIGYDSTTLVAMPYDWRLSIPNLQVRDAYFSRLKAQVEQFKFIYHEKVLMAAHSWGDNVARAFMHWAEQQQPGWVDNHIAVHFNVAGPTLGVPKAATALLSGEMRETSQLTGMAYFLGEQLLCKEDRTLLWRTWGSALGMLPIGGSDIWGTTESAPDDTDEMRAMNSTFGALISAIVEEEADTTESALSWVRGRGAAANHTDVWHLDAVDVAAEIVRDAGFTFLRHVQNWSGATLPADVNALKASMCPRHCDGRVEPPAGEPNDESESDWWPGQRTTTINHGEGDGEPAYPQTDEGGSFTVHNPLTTPLPNAPNLRIYCTYGYGLPTERKYHYKHFKPVASNVTDGNSPQVEYNLIKNTDIAQDQVSAGASWEVNRQAHNTSHGLEKGVQYGDGDGTVPLTSLGALCLGGWRHKSLNPHGVKVVTREYLNKQASIMSGGDLRGGPEMSAHVEILGNTHFLEDLLAVAAGWHDDVQDHIESSIPQIVGNISLWKD